MHKILTVSFLSTQNEFCYVMDFENNVGNYCNSWYNGILKNYVYIIILA